MGEAGDAWSDEGESQPAAFSTPLCGSRPLPPVSAVFPPSRLDPIPGLPRPRLGRSRAATGLLRPVGMN